MTDGVKLEIDFEEVNKGVKQLNELKEVQRQVAEDTKKGFKINNFGDSINARKQGKQFKKLEDRIKSREQQLEDAKNGVREFGDAASEAAEGASSSFESLKLGVAGLVASFLSIAGFTAGMKMANQYNELAERIKMATDSQDEFVTRAKVVRQPGTLGLMKDINARGWAAVAEQRIAYHSTGGLARMPEISAPSLPSINLSPAENINNQSVNNKVNVHMYSNPDDFFNAMAERESCENAVFGILEKNASKLKVILNS